MLPELWAAPRWCGALALVSHFGDISVSATLLPFFLSDVLHVDRAWVGGIFAIQYGCGTIGLFVTGLASDIFGHRLTLTTVMLMQAATQLIQGHVRSLGALIAVRAVSGFFASYGLGLTWVAHVSPPEILARSLAHAVLAAQFAVSSGGLVAGQLSGKHFWVACSILSAVPICNALALGLARDPAAKSSSSAAAGPSPLRGLRLVARSSPTFLAGAYCTFVNGCGFGLHQTMTPLLLKEDYAWGPDEIGHVFLVGGLVTLCCHATLTPFLSRRGPKAGVLALSLLNVGLLNVMAGWNWASAPLLFSLTIISYASNAVVLGVCNFLIAQAARAIAPEALAVATGITRCLFTFGQAVLPVLSVTLRSAVGAWLPFLMVSAAFVVGAVSMRVAMSEQPPALPAAAIRRADDDGTSSTCSPAFGSAASAAAASGRSPPEVPGLAAEVEERREDADVSGV